MHTRIKICGITRVEEAWAAARAGADAIGLVFHPQSPRALDVDQAAAIADELPPLVTLVGLFMDADAADVWRTLERVPLEMLQFHGREPETYCKVFGRRYIKALGMSGAQTMEAADWPGAAGLLVDSHAGERAGGSGETFDWSRVPDCGGRPVILAGGLHPENIAEAVRRVRPWGVDVSSGVESSPGHKDPERIRKFVSEVRHVG